MILTLLILRANQELNTTVALSELTAAVLDQAWLRHSSRSVHCHLGP